MFSICIITHFVFFTIITFSRSQFNVELLTKHMCCLEDCKYLLIHINVIFISAWVNMRSCLSRFKYNKTDVFIEKSSLPGYLFSLIHSDENLF